MEVLSICIGQTGCQVGSTIWNQFCTEHEINMDGSCAINDLSPSTFFQESSTGAWVPRTIFVDTEPDVVNNIKTGVQRKLHHPKSYIMGAEDAANCWARGRYNTGRALMKPTTDRIRNLMEECDNPQGILKMYSTGGGTGSGFGSCISDRFDVEYSKKLRLGLHVVPSAKLSTAIVEPHNTVLASDAFIDKSDASILYDNESLYRLCLNRLKMESPAYRTINEVIAQTVSFLTQCSRFECVASQHLQDFVTNMVPFPNMNLICPSLAPLCSVAMNRKSNITTKRNVEDCLNPQNYLLGTGLGKIFSVNMCFKGDNNESEIARVLQKYRFENPHKFLEFCPTPYKVSSMNIQMKTIENSELPLALRSTCAFINTSAAFGAVKRIQQQSESMWPAFSMWYEDNGMDYNYYSERIKVLNEFTAQYQDKLPIGLLELDGTDLFLDEMLLKVVGVDQYADYERVQLWVRTRPAPSKKEKRMFQKKNKNNPEEIEFSEMMEIIFEFLSEDVEAKISAYNIVHFKEDWEDNPVIVKLVEIYTMKQVKEIAVTEEDIKSLYRNSEEEPNIELLSKTVRFLQDNFTIPEEEVNDDEENNDTTEDEQV